MEIVITKAMDGSFRPSTEADAEYMGKIKAGRAIKVKAVQQSRRSLQHHRLFFGGLLGLAHQYWEPTGGLITPAERKTLKQFADWLDTQGGKTGAIRKAADAYLVDMEKRRSQRIEAPEKDIESLLEWVKIEVGHYDMISTPTGMIRRTKSINFNSMDQEEFDAFYKRAFSVVWRFILSQSFNNEAEAEEAINQLLAMG